VLHTVDDAGLNMTRTFRLVSHRAANALYRAMTEIYSFFRCDTVGNDISTQFSRDLKGTLASLFNEKTDLGWFYITNVLYKFYGCCRFGSAFFTIFFFFFGHNIIFCIFLGVIIFFCCVKACLCLLLRSMTSVCLLS